MKRTVSALLALIAVLTAFPPAAKSMPDNEQYIFDYLTDKMELNTAAACGILANIEAESSFNPKSEGKNVYGICQWYGARWTQLKNYCNSNGLDWHTLDGQLRFLDYELNLKENLKILNYIKGVENSADGAYDAGYYWCYYFERPANKAKLSVTRGSAAKDRFWPAHSGEVTPETEPEDDDAARITHISISETTATLSVTAKEEGMILLLCAYDGDGEFLSAQFCSVALGRGIYELEVPEGCARCDGVFLYSEAVLDATRLFPWPRFFFMMALKNI